MRKRGKKYDNYPQAADYAVATLLTALALAFTFFGLMPEGALKVRAEDTHTYTDSYGTWTYSILDEGTARIISFRISSTNPTSITIPSKVDDYTVTNLYLRFYNTIIQRVTIPNSVTTLGMSAFYCCEALESVTLSNSLTGIPDYAFDVCTNLKAIYIPDGVTRIGEGAFGDNENFNTIFIPSSVTFIASNAFSEVNALDIIGYNGSLAETYAKTKGYTFIDVDSYFDNITYTLISKGGSVITKPTGATGSQLSGVAEGTEFSVAPGSTSANAGKVISECKNYYIINIITDNGAAKITNAVTGKQLSEAGNTFTTRIPDIHGRPYKVTAKARRMGR